MMKPLTLVYMQFILFAKNCGYCFTAFIHKPHCTAQMMDSERAGVFTGLRLMHNDLVWLYSAP